MTVSFDSLFAQLEISGEDASTVFFSLAKIHKAFIVPYADEAGGGEYFSIGEVAYILQRIDGTDRLTVC